MTRLHIYLLFPIFLISCDRKKDTYFQLKIKAVNQTTSDLFYAVANSEYRDSAMVFPRDSVEFVFEKKGTVDLSPIIPYTYQIDAVGQPYEQLFNLSDTSRYYYLRNSDTWSERDSIYYNHTVYTVLGGGLEEYHSQVLTVTDTLLTIFVKDYTMLEKFKEYYQK